MVNRLLLQALPTQAASVLRLCLLLLFFFSSASLSGFHLGALPWGHLSLAGGLAAGNEIY
jgi:hypothetical protein